jgi:hypothetical protein
MLTLVLLLMTFTISAPLAAQNMVTNNSFPSNVTSWVLTDPSTSTAQWSALDADGAASGSVEVTNLHPDPSMGRGITQCISSVTPGNDYDWGGQILIPTGQSTSPRAMIGLRWYFGADCTGGFDSQQPRLSTTSTGAWASLDSTVTAPSGAISVLFLAFPSKLEAGGSLVSNFDNLYFGPPGTTPAELLSFEVE